MDNILTPSDSVDCKETSASRDSRKSQTISTISTPYNLVSYKVRQFNWCDDTNKLFEEQSPVFSEGADHYLPDASYTVSPLTIENSPIVSASGYYIKSVQNKSPKAINSATFTIDMSNKPKKSNNKNCENVLNDTKKHISNKNDNRQFYIDLASLPDPPLNLKDAKPENIAEKKNMFSMFIDLTEDSDEVLKPNKLTSNVNPLKKNVSKNNMPESSHSKDRQFCVIEQLCNDPNMTVTEIIDFQQRDKKTSKIKDNTSPNRMFTIGFTPKFAHKEQLLPVDKKPLSTNRKVTDSFVKLSDLDRPVRTDSYPKDLDGSMTKSAPANNQGEPTHTPALKPVQSLGSFHFENELSMSRLFPQLITEISASRPGSSWDTRSSNLKVCQPSETDEQYSDISRFSSVQSSICRSVAENSTTEDMTQTSILKRSCQSRLGQDLLRMFLEEIAPDVVVEVSGRRIKAHKCILSSRCQYFAGILSGGWVESAGNVIVLPPFSHNVVHFVLCHIYSGSSKIPDNISIVELATLTDMLGLEGLKEAIMYTLKTRYCHNFHRPCTVCTAGVLECFPLSSVYGLDDLCRKCLKWITKYFSTVWPTKAFATLPKELLEKCYQQHVLNITVENFADTVFGCGIIVCSVPRCDNWGTEVARLCSRLMSAAAYFAAPRLVAVFQQLTATSPDPAPPAAKALDDCLRWAIEWAPPDELCSAYAYLAERANQTKGDHSQNILAVYASTWRLQCEGALVRAAPRAVVTQAFKNLPLDLRKRLRELGCITYGTQSETSSSHKQNKIRSNTTQSLDLEHVRENFVPYVPKPVPKASQGAIPKIRTTKAQEERSKFNRNKKAEDKMQNGVKVRAKPYSNVKPRYLEKINKEEGKPSTSRKFFPTSSESSCHSSPVPAQRHPASRDRAAADSRPPTAEPSTDSLPESHIGNKFATYTKCRFPNHANAKDKSKTSQNVLSRTKIPVKKQNSRPIAEQKIKAAIPNTATSAVGDPVKRSRATQNERKITGSLMNATKSSSAKQVTKREENTKARPSRSLKRKESPPPPIPPMERSGTFLKETPTFGEKTTNLDEAQ